MFGDMVVISWTYSESKPEYAKQAYQDAEQLGLQLPAILNSLGLPSETSLRHTTHDGLLVAGTAMASQWRSLFAQSIIKLEHTDTKTGEPNA